MTNPVDLTNLREMTGGDTEIEKQLFEVFISSSIECIENMKKSVVENNELWRKNAHALKGTAFNLGANPLGELCKTAQEKFASGQSEKQLMLNQIEEEFGKVKSFIETLLK